MRKFAFLVLSTFLMNRELIAQTIDHWETAVFSNDTWKYLVGNSEPNTFWRVVVYDDIAWKTGMGGFGYGDGDDATIIDSCYALYLRKSFVVADTSKISEAILSIDFDDAFVAYINGIEIARAGIQGGYPPYNTLGTDHEAKLYTGGSIDNFTIFKSLLAKCIVPGVNIFGLQIHNSSRGSSDLTAIPYLSFGIADKGTYYRPSPPSLNLPRQVIGVSTTLPIVDITIPPNQTIPNSGSKINASMRVIDHGLIIKNQLTDSANGYFGTIGIEIRGASSANYPQQSYNIETRTDSGANRNVKLLGMPSENDWALIGLYNDKTLMRNVFSYQLFRSMGHYAPRTQYCEVYINKDYKGIYVLTEKIKLDNQRVNIAKPDPTATIGDNLSGGYIIKNDNQGSNESAFFSNYAEQGTVGNLKVSFIYEEPQSDEITEAQKKYVSAYINALENALYGPGFLDKDKGYRAYIDIPSFVDYFILGEVSRSVDAYKKSKYYFKDIDSKDGRLHSGPPWDYDWAYKNIPEGDLSKECYYGVTDGSAWAYKSIDCPHSPLFPGWVPRLMKDPFFANQLKTRYTELRKTILSNLSIQTFVDSVQTVLFEPQQRHFKKWDILGKNTIGSPEVDPQPATYVAAVTQLKNWLITRLNWLDKNMPGTITPITSIIEDDESNFLLFPNPAQHKVYIESNTLISKIELIAPTGHLLSSTLTQAYSNSIDVQKMSSGIYILKVRFLNGVTKVKTLVLNK